jgi:hypothetical protein
MLIMHTYSIIQQEVTSPPLLRGLKFYFDLVGPSVMLILLTLLVLGWGQTGSAQGMCVYVCVLVSQLGPAWLPPTLSGCSLA